MLPSLDKIWSFLTNDPLGLIILSIIASVIGCIIYESFKKLLKIILKKYKYRKFVKHLISVATAYVHGQRAALISRSAGGKSTFWAADYIISFIKSSVILLAVLLVTIIIMIIIPPMFYWVPVCATSVYITIAIRLIRRNLKYFDMTLDMILGEEYLKKEQEGYIQYWDKLTKKKKGGNQSSDLHSEANKKE